MPLCVSLPLRICSFFFFFFFNDTATTEIYTLSLHDALPIYNGGWTADPQGSKPGRNLGYTRYDKVAQDLGAHGEFVEKPHEIRPALERAWASGKPAVVNVVTDFKARAQTIRFSAYTT